MSKPVLFKGAPTNLGRFGFVVTGATLPLWLAEEISVRENPDFEIPAEEPLTGPPVALCGTLLCDLRTLEWENPKFTQWLAGKYQGNNLRNIVIAMREVGVNVPAEAEGGDADAEVIDNIARAGMAHGWNLLDRATRLNSPALPPEPSVEPEAEEPVLEPETPPEEPVPVKDPVETPADTQETTPAVSESPEAPSATEPTATREEVASAFHGHKTQGKGKGKK